MNVRTNAGKFWHFSVSAKVLVLVLYTIVCGAVLGELWRRNVHGLATGVIRPQDRFRVFVWMGDFLFYGIFVALLFVAINRLPPSRFQRVLKGLAVTAMVLLMIWKTCAIYLLAPSST